MPTLTQPPVLSKRWEASLEDHVISLQWSPPSGLMLAAASVSGPITLYDGTTGAVKQSWKGHGFGTSAIAWHPAGKLLASAGQDGKIRLWDVGSLSEVCVMEAGSAWAEKVAWSPRGDLLASAAGKKLRLWKPSGELVRAYPDASSTIADLYWGAKGKELVSGGYGGVAFRSPNSDEILRQYEWSGAIIALAPSPDGRYIAGGSQDAAVRFWITKTGKDLEMSGYPRKVRELAWDPDSQYLATGGGNIVTVWDCSGKGPAGSTPLSLELHINAITALAYQSRGPLLVSGCEDGIVGLWYPGGAANPLAGTQWEEGVSQFAWSPNDAKFAVGGAAGRIVVFTV